MTSTPRIQCPVCKARQAHQPTCRRCGADLTLYLKALHSLEVTRRQVREARQSGRHEQAADAASYLKWLKPDAAAQVAHMKDMLNSKINFAFSIAAYSAILILTGFDSISPLNVSRPISSP